MKDTEELQDRIKRQAEEIRNLKAERRALKEERRAYRRFYMQIMHRYDAMKVHFWGFLEEEHARYSTRSSDQPANLRANDQEPPGDDSTPNNQGPHCRPLKPR
jgi:hypothetical protein